jgi:oligosaccharide repeat unit polymerase
MELNLAIFILLSLCLFVFIKGKSLHNGDWLNPLSATLFLTIGLFTLGSLIAALEFADIDDLTERTFPKVIWVSSIYLLTIYLGYAAKLNPIRHFIYLSLAVFSSNFKTPKKSHSAIIIILFAALISYLALMVSSGVGLMWITDTRTAYQLYRVGTGHWWLIYQWLIMSAFFLCLFRHRRKLLSRPQLFLFTLIFSTLLFFSGSKGSVMSALLLAFLYLHYFLKKISLTKAFFTTVGAIIIFLGQLVSSGSYENIAGAFAYFVDYFYTTAQFMAQIDDIGYRYGQGWLSSLWFYVPRIIFQDKPYEYGLTLIHQVLFPGMAEQSYTPGILFWSLSYLDFGVAGVAIEGFLIGSFQRAVFVRFLLNKNVATFILLISVCYVPVFPYSTPIIYITIALLLGLINYKYISKQLPQPTLKI